MKKKTSTIIFVIIFLAGLSLLLYPFVANEWNNYRQKRLISSYESKVSELEPDGEIDYEAEWKRAEAFNQALLPSILPDSFAIASASGMPMFPLQSTSAIAKSMLFISVTPTAARRAAIASCIVMLPSALISPAKQAVAEIPSVISKSASAL